MNTRLLRPICIGIVLVLGTAALLEAMLPRRTPDHAADGGSAGCLYSSWSNPERVSDDAPKLFRTPALAARGGRVYAVGADVSLLDSGLVEANPILIASLAGDDIGRPAGNFTFRNPSAALDGEGTLHLVWLEPDEFTRLRRYEWHHARLTQVWYAAHGSGAGWTAPRKLYRSTFRLIPGPATLQVDAQNRVHMGILDLFGGARQVPGRESLLVHLVLDEGDWRISTEGISATRLSFGLSPDGRLYTAFIGGPLNSIFMVQSNDGGRTWSDPSLIQHSLMGKAQDIRLLVAPDGALHLVWGQNLSGELTPEVIRHVLSRDRGLTWSNPDDLDVPDDFLSGMRAAVDRCGAVHVVFDEWLPQGEGEEPRSEQHRLRYARWDQGWGVDEKLFDTLHSLEPDIRSTPDQLLLFWSARPAADSTLAPTFRPMMARLTVSFPSAGGS